MSNKKILIVDDYESIRQTIYEMITIKFSNITVVPASSGEAAVEKVKSCNYDLIFLDFDFGKGRMNGLETLKQIEKIRPEQNVYMLTGGAFGNEIEKELINRALGIMYKPVTLNKLSEIIEKYVLVDNFYKKLIEKD